MIPQYLRPQPSREGETAYIFFFIIFIMNVRPGTRQVTSVYTEMEKKKIRDEKQTKGPASLDN